MGETQETGMAKGNYNGKVNKEKESRRNAKENKEKESRRFKEVHRRKRCG